MRPEDIRSWKAPDGLGYSGLRPVRLSAAGYAMLAFSAIFVIGGLVLGVFLWNQSRRESADRLRLENEGVRAQATVVRLWKSGDKESTPRLRYRFEVEGQVVTGSARVPRKVWSALHTGDTISVRYIPANPAINHPEAWSHSVTPAFLAALVPAMFLGFAALFGVIITRQSRLLSEGRPAPGVVIKARRTDKAVSVTYEFRVLSGATRKGRSSASGKNVPAVGSVVCVIYDPDNPRRNGLYPFSLVRLEKRADALRPGAAYSRCAFKNRPVCDVLQADTCSGVPVTTISPPACPPSGPRSITWSAVLITSI